MTMPVDFGVAAKEVRHDLSLSVALQGRQRVGRPLVNRRLTMFRLTSAFAAWRKLLVTIGILLGLIAFLALSPGVVLASGSSIGLNDDEVTEEDEQHPLCSCKYLSVEYGTGSTVGITASKIAVATNGLRFSCETALTILYASESAQAVSVARRHLVFQVASGDFLQTLTRHLRPHVYPRPI